MSGSCETWSAEPPFGRVRLREGQSWLGLFFLVPLLLLGDGRASVAHAAEPGPVIGLKGTYLVGRWAEVSVPFEVSEPGIYTLRIAAPDPDGHQVTFESKSNLAPGRQILRGFTKVGRFDPAIQVEIVSDWDGKVQKSWALSREQGTTGPIDPAWKLILTVGKLPAFEWNDELSAGGTAYRSIPLEADELPGDPLGYDLVTLLVISGRPVLSPTQSVALREWVQRGGRLLLSLPLDVKQAQEAFQPLADWIPASLGAEPVTVSEFGKLEFFAGKNVRVPFGGRLRIPSVKIDQGEVLAGSRDEALLVRAPYGLGSVTILALDVTQPPLSRWTELPALGRRLAESFPASAGASSSSRNIQLSSTGISDLATQLHAIQEEFPEIHRASPWLAMGLLVGFLLVIGPVDYLVVHRLLQRPRSTWITFPVWVALSAILVTNLASSWNGSSIRFNQLNLVNYDASSSSCHQRMWTNVYAPTTGRRSLAVESAVAPSGPERSASQQTCWSGIAETAYGGMLGPSGIKFGAADYRLAGETEIDGLPLAQWSTKELVTEVHSSSAGLVSSDLHSNGVGQLSGTVAHRFGGPIEDWFLAFGNRVYRHKKSRDDPASFPLPANQVMRIDQPKVFPRELNGFLTGKVATGTASTGSAAVDVTSVFNVYDPLARDSAETLRTLTFHSEVGGAKFTSLTNRLLESEDLSHLLKLGRAVLFGRLNTPISIVTIDGAKVAPSREETFIRIVLPVRKVGNDVNRALERLEK